ncbi:MAG: 23S rRNA (uracil(1939)-C(5))-methyltransferase RlmD [Synergistaceae bacterium]|nr:23S rRNA (uracil(1939)-C(5))-methyltransferase RlmD [Synergistaceae bacterium]
MERQRENRAGLKGLAIFALSSDGTGIARTEQGVIFVSGALPGEVVTAEIVARHKDFSVARLVEIEQEAEGRVEPRCQYYGKCGGCQLQHASYPLQLRLKAGLVRDAMTRIGGFDTALFERLECAASPDSWGYRNKASFPVQSTDFKGKGRRIAAGFYRPGTHRLELIRRCPVNAAPLNALYESLLGGLSDLPFDGYDERTHEGKLRHIVMRAGMNTGQTLLSFVLNGRLSAKGLKALIALGSKGKPTTLTLNHNSRPGNVILGPRTEALIGDGRISERLGEWMLGFDTTSFFQVNTAQAERLFDYASTQVEESGKILELYSGVGSMTCFLSRRGTVTSVEGWRSAVQMAERNLKANGIETQALCGRAEEVIEDLHEDYDTVVMDPPRDGCARVVLEAVSRFKIPRVVYVSCNPATLARDCKILVGRGYRLTSVRAFDMFPQTAHVETVAVLSRTN